MSVQFHWLLSESLISIVELPEIALPEIAFDSNPVRANDLPKANAYQQNRTYVAYYQRPTAPRRCMADLQ